MHRQMHAGRQVGGWRCAFSLVQSFLCFAVKNTVMGQPSHFLFVLKNLASSSCAICHEEMKPQGLQKLTCGHFIHVQVGVDNS